MSLAALAVVNRQNTPLYLRDYANESHQIFNLDGQLDDINDGGSSVDIFGDNIEEMSSKQLDNWPCNIKYQFLLHSATQRLEEVLKGNKWKAQGASGMENCWVGFLCSSDNMRAYGYITTNTRYITLVEDSIENTQVLKARESELCVLMANIHRVYTEILMNPFTALHSSSKITSKRFDSCVTSFIQQYNGN